MLALFTLPIQSTDSVLLPVNTAYVVGWRDPREVGDEGTLSQWTDHRTSIEWGGRLQQAGDLHILLHVQESSGQSASFMLQVLGKTLKAQTGSSDVVDFGTIHVDAARWISLRLHGGAKSGETYGKIEGLELIGDAAAGAKFNRKERRNTASVHLVYPLNPGEQPEWFYNEVQPKDIPQNTFFMACGFARGYFGIQANSGTERRIIFSVWDSGNEAVSRTNVADDNRVKLISKGDGVVAGDFGNEGTGGHSHLVYHWKSSEPQRFLLHAQPSGSTTTYTGYFFFPDGKGWSEIASFRAPKDGKYLHGLYSFIEDFWGDNGNVRRGSYFGPGWIRDWTGKWRQLSVASFSHDGTGGKDRFDYDFKVAGNRFWLQTGGFEGASPNFGEKLTAGTANPPGPDVDAVVNGG